MLNQNYPLLVRESQMKSCSIRLRPPISIIITNSAKICKPSQTVLSKIQMAIREKFNDIMLIVGISI